MTAAQNTIRLKGSNQLGGLLAAAAAALLVAVIAVAISARPVVAPSTTDVHLQNLPPTPHYRDVTAPRHPHGLTITPVVGEHPPAPQLFVARDVIHTQTLPRKPSLPNLTRHGGPHKGR